MSIWEDNILREPIARNAGAVLSLPVQGNHRHFKTRFLGEDIEGIWIEAPPATEQALVDACIASKAQIAVAFKAQATKFTFATVVESHRPSFATGEGQRVPAMLVQYPNEIRSVQLRAHLRVNIPEENEIACRVWRLLPRAGLLDAPAGSSELNVKLKDISVGGLGLCLLPLRGKPASVVGQERLRILMAYREIAILVEGTLLHPTPTPEGVEVGIEFAKNDCGTGNESKLTRIKAVVVAMHRAENPASKLDEKKVAI